MSTILSGSFAALLLALAAAPAANAQTAEDLGAGTPAEVLAQTWTEALGGAEAVARALDDVADDTTGAAPETLGEVNRARGLAAVASASTAAMLIDALLFSVALADPAEQPTVIAALADDALGMQMLLLLVAETVNPPPDDPTLMTAPMQNPDGSLAEDMEPEAEDWAVRADQIREAVGRLRGATAALGLTAP